MENKGIKTANQIIIDLQNKNANLRLSLGILLKSCHDIKEENRTLLFDISVQIGLNTMEETDPNKKKS